MATNEILVVTGLPRSGTSMLMRMLGAGGVPLLVDDTRVADDHNPRGYFEFAAVKRLKEDATWLPQARGKAVKVVSYLVPFLPEGERYRFLMIERSLAEIVSSQQKMLRKAAAPADDGLEALLSRQNAHARAWMTRAGGPLLMLQHRAVLADPRTAAAQVAAWLADWNDALLDVAAMAAAVEPQLHRNRVV